MPFSLFRDSKLKTFDKFLSKDSFRLINIFILICPRFFLIQNLPVIKSCRQKRLLTAYACYMSAT